MEGEEEELEHSQNSHVLVDIQLCILFKIHMHFICTYVCMYVFVC